MTTNEAGRNNPHDRGLLERFGESVKSLAAGSRKVPFGSISQSGAMGGYGYGGLGAGTGGWGGHTPGATYDYQSAAGELWENRVVAACVNAIAQALADAPPYLEQREGNTWAKVPTHPVIELLNAPNGYYGSPHLWSATAASECTVGQAFWRIEKSRAGVPAELWWEDARRFRALGNADEFISGYRFQTERGSWMELENDEVIHFRHALNPYNPREGRTPLITGLRQIALDNGIASYSGSILRNSGVMSLLISAKDAASGAQISPSQLQEFVEKLKQRLFGDGAGGIAGLNLPIEVQKMSYSPDEMAVDKLTSYAEASICALIGVDPMVCGLGSGTQQRTYANMGEALNDFWERRIIPTKNRHSAELGAQLLPLFGLDPKDYRIAWDYSKVAALQENEDQKHARVREDYRAGLLDLYDAQTLLGIAADEAKRGVYYGQAKGGGIAAKYDPNQPRDEHGRWTDGSREYGHRTFWEEGDRDDVTTKLFNGRYEVSITGRDVIEDLCQKYFGRHLADTEWGQLVGAPDNHNLRVKPYGNSIDIRIEKGEFFSKVVLRKVHKSDERTDRPSYLELESLYKSEKGPKDLAPRMLAYVFKKSQSLGIDVIFANAAGDSGNPHGDIGYWRWPQLGFDAKLTEDDINVLPPELRGATQLSHLIQKPGGLVWWRENGHGVEVEFDLHPKSVSRQTFEAYLSSKNIKI